MTWLSNPPVLFVRIMSIGRAVDKGSPGTVHSDSQGRAHFPHSFVAQPTQPIDKNGD